MLQTDPKLVHLYEVRQNEADGVIQISERSVAIELACACVGGRSSHYIPLVIANWKMFAGHTTQVEAEKESPGRVLHAACHFHHVLHDLFPRRFYGHVHGSDGDH